MTAPFMSYRNSFFTLALKVNRNANENENQDNNIFNWWYDEFCDTIWNSSSLK